MKIKRWEENSCHLKAHAVCRANTAACCSHAARTALTFLHRTRQAMAVPTCPDVPAWGSSHRRKRMDKNTNQTNKKNHCDSLNLSYIKG